MNRTVASLLATTLLLCACDRTVLETQSNVRMTVVDRKNGGRRFWVSLQEDQTGRLWKEVRFSGKWCSKGPARLPIGSSVMVRVETYRDEDTGRRTEHLDKTDLDRQFC
jgi:hypothetical protein